MSNFKECSIWEKTDIIDIPYLPFGGERKATSEMINELAKYVKEVKNLNFRETYIQQNIQNERRFFFQQADTLLGLDISVIDYVSQSYLDQFFFLLKMYPLVMVNSYMSRETIRTIALHSYCLEHYYILPVFGAIPFFDKASVQSYYPASIVDLFKGKRESIDLKKFECLSKDYTKERIKRRFPQFYIKNDKVFFQPEITWLGINCQEIEDLLSFLFNKNVERFNLKKVCEEFNIKEELLNLYIEKSMLFCRVDEEEIIFRLQRKNIYWGFICNLATQFEHELIERDAIKYDIKIEGDIGIIKQINEKIYHKMGNVFLKYDGFTNKMFSYIKRLLEQNIYSDILIVDNGNMSGIKSMIQGMGLHEHLYEVLDYYSVAVQYPNIDYKELEYKSVLVIVDVINTGKLLESTLDILKKINCSKIGVFSFIINYNYNLDIAFNEENIEIFYFTEKALDTIDNILDKEYSERFNTDEDLNFKLLWGDVGKNINLKENKTPYSLSKNKINYKEYFYYDFDLMRTIDIHSYIYQKVKHILKGRGLILIYEEYKEFKRLVDLLNLNEYKSGMVVETIEKKDISLSKMEPKYENKDVLFIIPNNLIGNTTKYIENNRLGKVEFLNLVKYEVYFLDNDEVFSWENKNRKFIVLSKLKAYRGMLKNPQMDILRE